MPDKAEQGEAPQKAEERNEPTISQTIKADLHRWDYRLWMNDMDDSIWNGDKKMTDADFAVLRTRARPTTITANDASCLHLAMPP